jgi:hypothetical protein
MTHSKGGWYGDSEEHRDCAKQQNENWFQTRWRRLKEWVGRRTGGD